MNAQRTSPRERDGSLRDVRAAIPAECYERPTYPALRAIAVRGALYVAVMIALVVARPLWLVVPLWIVAAFVLSSLFVLAHDAAHGALFRDRRMNELAGRFLMLPHLHLYSGWVVGHNRLHHGHTVRESADFVWHPLTVDEYRALSPLRKLRHRVEWGPLGAGLYYTRVVWWQKMVMLVAPEKHRRPIRRDLALVAGFALAVTALLVGLGAWRGDSLLAGIWLWAKVFVVPWFLFMWMIGWTVYVHHIDDDLRWWERPTWNAYHGQVEGTTVLHAPRLANFFFLNIFLHVPHHVDTRIPFHALPRAAAAIVAEHRDAVTERQLRLSDYVRTVRHCKLYDFERQRWLPYAAAR